MLIVYEDERAMEEAENEKNYTNEGFPSYYHSGITPPMKRVVERRYLSRFEERDTKPIPPPKSQVSEVEKDLQGLISKLAVKGKGGKKGSSKSKAKLAYSVAAACSAHGSHRRGTRKRRDSARIQSKSFKPRPKCTW